jgi:actinin alpha
MAWSIILDFAIKGISVDDLNAKEGLLMWVRKKTAGYRDVDPPSVSGFTRDWRNGLAFCALIHKHYPNLIDYANLKKENARENLELAFKVTLASLSHDTCSYSFMCSSMSIN